MQSTINRNIKVPEIKETLRAHNIETGHGWEVMLYLLFNTYETEELTIEGFGQDAKIHP